MLVEKSVRLIEMTLGMNFEWSSQIWTLEISTLNVIIGTILKVFNVLSLTVNFRIVNKHRSLHNPVYARLSIPSRLKTMIQLLTIG